MLPRIFVEIARHFGLDKHNKTITYGKKGQIIAVVILLVLTGVWALLVL